MSESIHLGFKSLIPKTFLTLKIWAVGVAITGVQTGYSTNFMLL